MFKNYVCCCESVTKRALDKNYREHFYDNIILVYVTIFSST